MNPDPDELARDLADRARALRLYRDLSQQGLADRAGVSLGSLKRFERTGQIALTALLRLAVALEAEAAFADLFALPRYASLDEALATKPERQRGRRR